ncbi:hypothetical protein [Nocardiopsis suaedae]|uniref:Uncharacterized protein n=1 Tax=Nocardiopsis suaedae TaxID=3018444 RepID=A0ABT4TJY5_9ACTN|nr:hypothetical protein [Nocardiopsis suaedae]MDA2804574.1 hypothetical protein [Nocardiopsis suaedae]
MNPQSYEHIDGSAAPTEPPPQTVIPSDFTLSEQMRAWAAKHTPALDADEATEAFVDHYLSKGELRADWNAAWRSWMRTRSRWQAEKRQAPTSSGFQPFRNPAEDDGDPNAWA